MASERAGNVTRCTIEDLSIDDTVIGVKGVDADNENLVATYLEPVRQSLTALPAEVADSTDNSGAQ